MTPIDYFLILLTVGTIVWGLKQLREETPDEELEQLDKIQKWQEYQIFLYDQFRDLHYERVYTSILNMKQFHKSILWEGSSIHVDPDMMEHVKNYFMEVANMQIASKNYEHRFAIEPKVHSRSLMSIPEDPNRHNYDYLELLISVPNGQFYPPVQLYIQICSNIATHDTLKSAPILTPYYAKDHE